MIDIVYPIDLPQRPETDNFSRTIGHSDVIVSDMDTGPSKRRRRSQANPIPYQMNIVVDIHQLEVFEDWYENTLKGGIMTFEWADPIKQTPAYFQFTNPTERPTATPYNNAGNLFTIQLNLSMLP